MGAAVFALHEVTQQLLGERISLLRCMKHAPLEIVQRLWLNPDCKKSQRMGQETFVTRSLLLFGAVGNDSVKSGRKTPARRQP